MAPSRRKAKTHVLKNTDLRTIIEPADPDEVAFTATKGETTSWKPCPIRLILFVRKRKTFNWCQTSTKLSQDDSYLRAGSAVTLMLLNVEQRTAVVCCLF